MLHFKNFLRFIHKKKDKYVTWNLSIRHTKLQKKSLLNFPLNLFLTWILTFLKPPNKDKINRATLLLIWLTFLAIDTLLYWTYSYIQSRRVFVSSFPFNCPKLTFTNIFDFHELLINMYCINLIIDKITYIAQYKRRT